jgi:hypothetical protein
MRTRLRGKQHHESEGNAVGRGTCHHSACLFPNRQAVGQMYAAQDRPLREMVLQVEYRALYRQRTCPDCRHGERVLLAAIWRRLDHCANSEIQCVPGKLV